MADFVCGANKEHFHIQGVNWGRDLPEPEQVADLRNVVAGDPSPDGKGTLSIMRGIEVGHVFYLGKKYLRPSRPRSWTRPASPPRWKWAATASA